MTATTTMRPPGDDDVSLLVEVLQASADTRRRAATRAAVELEAERAASKDVRAGALRVTRLLAQAGRLEEVARELEAGRLRLVAIDPALAGAATPVTPLALVPPPPAAEEPTTVTAPAATPREPTEDEADAATRDAEAILEQAFPGDDPDLGTVIPEHPLPAGQGADDDPDPSVDVLATAAELEGLPTEEEPPR